jgi:hypothetical protein
MSNLNCFVDMDGTIADLFGAISFRFFNKPYKQLTVEEKTKAKKIWYDREHFLDNFGDVEKFFANLPPFGKNGEITNAIIQTVVKFAGEYSICSHPASIDPEACKRGKITWIKNHLSPQPSESYFPKNKAIYAVNKDGRPNVLIDDFPPYLAAWKNAGGIAIEMRADSYNSVVEVERYLTGKLNEAQKQIEQNSVKESFDFYVKSYLTKYTV